jgi:hypothetical protein
MTEHRAWAVARFRFHATLRHRWSGYVAIAVLIGILGGVAMGSIAAARRTQSSFTTFLASTNPSDLTLAVFPGGSSISQGFGYSASLTSALRHLPEVRRVESWVQPQGLPLARNGVPAISTLSRLTAVGSLDGLSFDIDRAAVVQGVMADPKRPDQFVTTVAGAQALGWHVGQVVPFGFYAATQIASPGFTSGAVVPTVRVEAKLVGLVQFSTSVVQDQVDRYPTFALFTPALSRRLVAAGTTYATYYGIQTRTGSQGVPALEAELQRVLPPNDNFQVHVASLAAARTDRAIRPEAIALGVFGLIAALATVAIASQALARQLRTNETDLGVLRALGASPRTELADSLLGAVGAIVVGALIAAGVAVALSPIGPIGPVRVVYPDRGIAFDWTVLGAGVAVTVVVLSGVALALAVRMLPHRRAVGAPTTDRRRIVASAAADAGLPPSTAAGVRFALESGQGASSVPVRSAIAATVLAVIVVVATLTFGSGLATLVNSPALYGWNWSYALFSETGPDVPPQDVSLLTHDSKVAAFSEAESADPQIDGQSVPAIFEPAGAAVVPPILSGHAPTSKRQVVLGAATMAQVHTHVGGTVVLSFGSPATAPFYLPPTPLTVVGTATFPAIGFPSSEGDHTSMGIGILIPSGAIPKSFAEAMQSSDPTLNGPEYVFVRMRDGVSHSAAATDMTRIARAGDSAFAADPTGQGEGDTVLVASDLLPAEIVNYRSIGATPTVLAACLAVGAVVGLGLTLAASVRRRRRDLALLKTLGFTGRQVSTTVAVQATVVGLIGLVVGIPLGIVLGRWLWTAFAREIYAVPAPTVPTLSLVLVAVVALVLVNVVAVVPGRTAARTPTALVLRSE